MFLRLLGRSLKSGLNSREVVSTGLKKAPKRGQKGSKTILLPTSTQENAIFNRKMTLFNRKMTSQNRPQEQKYDKSPMVAIGS